jgi:hypothetical protein
MKTTSDDTQVFVYATVEWERRDWPGPGRCEACGAESQARSRLALYLQAAGMSDPRLSQQQRDEEADRAFQEASDRQAAGDFRPLAQKACCTGCARELVDALAPGLHDVTRLHPTLSRHWEAPAGPPTCR